MSKTAKILIGVVILLCSLSWGLWAHNRDIVMYERTIAEAKKYVLEVPLGTPASAIKAWLKQKSFTCEITQNNGTNDAAYMMITNAKLSPDKIGSFMGSWIDKPFFHPNNKGYNFNFFLDKRGLLVKANIHEYTHRNLDF